jgi:PTS system nitrogen regulatory IIA component
LASRNAGIQPEAALEVLRERERLGTTALEGGVAIPHGRVAGLSGPIAVLARSATGVEWGAPDGVPSRLIFVLLTPAEQSGSHLKLLAEVSRVLRNSNCRERLTAAANATEMLAAIRACEDGLERR